MRLARVNLDSDGLEGLRRMAVVMPTLPMMAIRSVDMGCLRRGGDHGRMRMGMGVTVCRAVFMATGAVKSPFRLKRFIDGFNRQVHGAQHVGQNRVRLDFQVVGFQFNRHMAVAQLVGGTRQVEGRTMRRAGRDAQHGLRRSNDPHHRAVFDQQHVAATHPRALRQKHAERATQRIERVEAAFLAHSPVEFKRASALEQHRGQAGTLRQQSAGPQQVLFGRRCGFCRLVHQGFRSLLKKSTFSGLFILHIAMLFIFGVHRPMTVGRS